MHSFRYLSLIAWLAAVLSCAPEKNSAIIRAADFSQENYKGKVILLNFWATWCGPCIYEIPDLIKVRSSFSAEKVAIFGIAMDRNQTAQSHPKIKQFVQQYGINYPIVLDNRREVALRYYSAEAIPVTFLIDQQGGIYRAFRGLPVDAAGQINALEAYADAIQELLDRI